MGIRRASDVVEQLDIQEEDDKHVDALTGLADRWQLEAWLSNQLERNRRTGDKCALLLFSVSNLTRINSGYGSAVGDEVLQAIADSLSTSVGNRGQTARYLGSEFAVMWPGVFANDDVYRVADDLMSVLPEQVTFESFVVPLEVTVAGLLCEFESNERRLLVDLESALVEARTGDSNLLIRDEVYGRGREPEILAVRLQQAFENDEFQLFFQPVVSLASGVIVGFESFLRWLAPNGGAKGAELMSPAVFMEALRTSPIVVPLHAWILRETISQVAEWDRQLGNPGLFSAMNLDPSFVLDSRFSRVVTSAIADLGVRPNQVLLDVNGGTAGPQLHLMWPALQQLKAEGVGIALEDFGVGFGSPDLLRRCRFDVIRLPRVFVGGLGLAEEDRLIVGSLINLAHEIGCTVVAEGVETEYQAEVLAELGCDFVQGFLFGRPIHSSEVAQELGATIELAKFAAEIHSRVTSRS